jgi:hypothetical protein
LDEDFTGIVTDVSDLFLDLIFWVKFAVKSKNTNTFETLSTNIIDIISGIFIQT